MRTLITLLLILLTRLAIADQPATPRTDEATRTIRRQVKQLSNRHSGIAPEYLFSVATLNYVQSRLSSLNYSARKTDKQPLPANVEQCLEMQAGICGNHIATFLELAGRLNIRARPVEFYIHGKTPAKNHNHICVEVFYNDRWQFFDITWGTFFRKPAGPLDNLASIDEIRANADSRKWAITNNTDVWYQQWKAAGLDPLEYIDHRQVDVLRGRAGTIRLVAVEKTDTRQKFQPIHQPNFVGRNRANTDFGSITLALRDVDPATKTMKIHVAGLAGSGQLIVTAGDQRIMVPLTGVQAGQTITADLSKLVLANQLQLHFQSNRSDGIGYLVYQDITLITLQ